MLLNICQLVGESRILNLQLLENESEISIKVNLSYYLRSQMSLTLSLCLLENDYQILQILNFEYLPTETANIQHL